MLAYFSADVCFAFTGNADPTWLRADGMHVMRARRSKHDHFMEVPLPPSFVDIKEGRARDAAKRYQMVQLQLPDEMATKPVGATYIGPTEEGLQVTTGQSPVVFLHGFDSSALEFRRLLPELESAGTPVYVLDLLGWGFGDVSGVQDFSPSAKRAHLYAFWKQHLDSQPMVLGGASLGGGIAIDFAVAYPEAVDRLVLIDPQAFIDGAPKLGPFGAVGIKLLASWPLRWIANRMAYFDKDKFATDDAIRVGRLHVELDGWESASLDYLNSGGYTLSPLVNKVTVPVLLLWGEHDEILDGSVQVPRFLAALGGPVRMEWVSASGHVPHLEQPQRTAQLIIDFLRTPALDLQLRW